MNDLKIIDSHCHIYPDKIAKKVVDSVERFYGGLPYPPYPGTSSALLETGRSAGISHFIVHSVATKPEQVETINCFIADTVQKANGSFTGLGTLHPDSETLSADLEHLIRLGLKGVKIHPDLQGFRIDGRKAFRIFELCEEKGLPVLVHTGDVRMDYSNPERTRNVLRAFPKLTIIGAHFAGWSVWDRAALLLPDFPNLLVDTSSSFYWMKPQRAKSLIRAYGADRVLFGTDFPMWPQTGEIAFLNSLELEHDEMEKICWRNCAGIYGIALD